MTHISEIIIQGFQIHEDTHMYLSPNLNAIIGETDQGKSSVFRAIRWVARNLPNTESYINHNLKKALVALVLSNGFKVERYRDNKENLYRIYKDGGLIHELKAIRGSVPDKVMEILNMTELNFEKQFTMPFMISESGGEVARMWNKVSGMDLADIMKKNLSFTLKETKKDLEDTSNKIQDEIDLQLQLEPVREARKHFNKALEIDEQIKSNTEEADTVRSLIGKIEELQDTFDYYSILKDFLEADVKHLDSLKQNMEDAQKQKDNVSDICNRIRNLENQIDVSSKVLNIEGLDELNNLVVEINSEQKKLENLISVTEKIEKIQTDIVYEERKIESYKSQIEELKENITECPLCGGKI